MNRTFRADDGTEISEEDVLEALRHLNLASDVYLRISAALAPKACGAVIWRNDGGNVILNCVLPAGHHPVRIGFDINDESGDSNNTFPMVCCDAKYSDPIHSPGHMTAPETWSES